MSSNQQQSSEAESKDKSQKEHIKKENQGIPSSEEDNDSTPSIIDKLREKANKNFEAKKQEYVEKQQEEKKNKRRLFKKKFKFKKDSKEAKEKVKKLGRKEKKKLREEYRKLQKLTQRELIAYKMLNDPNNDFMKKIQNEGNDGLMTLQQNELWKSIYHKKMLFNDINDFLNHLTDDEFTEFIQNREIQIDKLAETGKDSEIFRSSLKEQLITLSEQEQIEEFKQKYLDHNIEEAIESDDISQEFKVFKDPTFTDFIKIVGTNYNQELPLYAQLYILREILQFYQLHQNQQFFQIIGFNVLFNLAYYFFNYKFLLRRHIYLFNLPRIVCIFFMSLFLQEQLITKLVTMNNYRVNINDLFDIDEDFLFQNEHFRAMIKKIKVEFDQLVNPIFDMDEIIKDVSSQVSDKYKIPAGGYQQMNEGELILLYSMTFNAPARSRQQYNQMIKKYDEFFKNAIKKNSNKLQMQLQGFKLQEMIKKMIEFYDSYQVQKHVIKEKYDEEFRNQFYEAKKQSYQLMDAIIESLNKDFDEKKVTVYSSRAQKVNYLRQLSKELEPRYKDQEKFRKIVEDRHKELMTLEIGKQERFIPKPDLRYAEYLAIKDNFDQAEFERNSIMLLALPVVSFSLYFFQRVGRKMKWL
ncbi:UNKNOWN [Stylonychia lemnae]|uniref:Transmembrane protein n=1 Tax=Stylonychia lemnae TaxID=5949 RepID=A0A078ACI7_STYLE|nr:UNKNOWN [Stylonychia lemnae]|eukprot:CDW79965.1 UNKNOWN [Stylonychia lemnae]